jgi:hypothetical protein
MDGGYTKKNVESKNTIYYQLSLQVKASLEGFGKNLHV